MYILLPNLLYPLLLLYGIITTITIHLLGHPYSLFFIYLSFIPTYYYHVILFIPTYCDDLIYILLAVPLFSGGANHTITPSLFSPVSWKPFSSLVVYSTTIVEWLSSRLEIFQYKKHQTNNKATKVKEIRNDG
jgi:hypothetical protein